MLKQQEQRDLPSMEAESVNSQMSYSSADFSDREFGSHTGDSFNGFDHQEAYHINNANMTDMLNHDQELDNYQKRLKTFERWPADSAVQPKDLAAAGFYSGGLDDRVTCFKCGLHLRQWNAGDDPWTEHKKFRPDCHFIKNCENTKDYEVTCSPVEASVNTQERSQPSFTPTFQRYGDRIYLTGHEQHEGPVYSERPQYATQGGGGYGNGEQSYPVDTQTGFQQVYYPGRTQEFLRKDPSGSVQYRRPEHEQIGTDRHVVVRQGSSQVHIVGSAVYKLTPEDKLYIHGGGQGYPQHIRSERELRPVYPEAQQTSQFPSMESSYAGSHPATRESSQYPSEVQMTGRNQFPQSTVSNPPSHAGSFSKQFGYQYPGEKSSSSQNTAAFQEGNLNAKYMMRPYRESDKMEYGRETLQETRPSVQQYMPERKTSNEEERWQENYHSSQRYPGTNAERDKRPSPPPQDRSRQQAPPVRSVQGPRRPSPAFAAFPVKDPSLQTAQRPLIRKEEARHVTSSAELSSEHHRLTTFVDWPHDHHIRAWDLAAAGFYYLGTGDSVKCYKCGIPLHNWDLTDTPWGEHKKWSPMCPLVLEQFSGRPHQVQGQHTPPEQRVPSAQEELQNRRPEQSQGPNERNLPFRSGNPPPVHGTWGASEQFPVRKVSNGANQRNPAMERQHSPWYTQPMTTSSEEGHMTSERQTCSTGESGSRTPSETPQGPRNCSPRGSTAIEFDMEKLAEMGFTQQEIQDVITFQLEATGSNFNTFPELVAALLERQQARSPCCASFPQPTPQEGERPPSPPRLTIPSGVPARMTSPRENEDFRERNCLSAVTSPTTPVPNKSSLRRTLSEPASRSSESAEESLEEKLERMQEERTCKICMDAEVGVVFLPCGHFSCCADCANGMDFCPMCRTPIQEKIRTYLS
ncbi:uncharacterized protein LOC144658879 [Oculina patagonica]